MAAKLTASLTLGRTRQDRGSPNVSDDVLRPASKAWSDILPTIRRFFKAVKLPFTWRANKHFNVDFRDIQQLYKSRNVNI